MPSGLMTFGIESSRSNISSLLAEGGGAGGSVSSSPTSNGKLYKQNILYYHVKPHMLVVPVCGCG